MPTATRPETDDAPQAPTAVAKGPQVLLGDEAVALAAVDAGIRAAYAYPGTPSTEILEYLRRRQTEGGPRAVWCVNEKTAYEHALGASMAGARSLVSMKHVGLNVAADPFINSALVSIRGGLVVVVADDPGMHSSQNEQDSRHYADLARVICLEPADQQQAYEMTREAFGLSERFRVPVLVRLVTRLAHSRASVRPTVPERPPLSGSPLERKEWILLPVNARRQWRALLERQDGFRAYSEACPHNVLTPAEGRRDLGVITTGLARNYYLENLGDLDRRPAHLHLGAYPVPGGRVRRLASQVDALLVLEDGYPFVERQVRGVLPTPVPVLGKESGALPSDGELDPDVVRSALGLAPRSGVRLESSPLVPRPPRLCSGCAHRDAYAALREAVRPHPEALVTADIGCYTLGALPPYAVIESCVCMGASIGMAKGASEAGRRPVVAVIGDSTFLHSGVTTLMDAVAADADMTVLILDNGTVAMTGAQPPVLPSSSLEGVVRGTGVAERHCRVIEAHPRRTDEMVQVLREEMDHRGLSVVISVRECLESVKRRKRECREGGAAS